jgi:hypothetical protein
LLLLSQSTLLRSRQSHPLLQCLRTATINQISLQALSITCSTSNLTATVNVKNSSSVRSMSLFVNGTYVGSYNHTRNAWGCDQCFRWMRAWSKGTSSYFFTATPYWMPMMGRWNWGDYGGMAMMGGGGSTESHCNLKRQDVPSEEGTTITALLFAFFCRIIIRTKKEV